MSIHRIHQTTNPMLMKIEALWAALEADSTSKSGRLYRRYATAVKPDVFAGIGRTGNAVQRLLVVSLPAPVTVQNLTLQDLLLSLENDPARPGRQLVLLALTNPAHNDLFAVVCEDLITQVADETEPTAVLNALLSRLEQWTALFDTLLPDGLSVEKRQGLFGELWFLNRWLDAGADPAYCLTAWTGPGGSIHDFQLPSSAVELKTTAAVSPQIIRISNERQLDDTGLTNLWLWLLTLDVRPTGGQSLNDCVDTLLSRLTAPAQQTQFRLKLYQVGYHPQHRDLYDSPTYTVRREEVFRVGAGFPRLLPGKVPAGVSAVQYAINLIACQPFTAEANVVLSYL